MGLVYIMSGPPGSGKSYFARQSVMAASGPTLIVSADNFFISKNGSYQFDGSKLGKAHRYCLGEYLKGLQTGSFDLIVVDNTNLNAWEASPYVALAKLFGYKPEIIKIRTPLEVCLARQTHGVPPGKLRHMWKRAEKLKFPIMWYVKTISGV